MARYTGYNGKKNSIKFENDEEFALFREYLNTSEIYLTRGGSSISPSKRYKIIVIEAKRKIQFDHPIEEELISFFIDLTKIKTKNKFTAKDYETQSNYATFGENGLRAYKAEYISEEIEGVFKEGVLMDFGRIGNLFVSQQMIEKLKNYSLVDETDSSSKPVSPLSNIFGVFANTGLFNADSVNEKNVEETKSPRQ